MELKLDLHIHSDASPDGSMSVAEIAEACRAVGLQGCAICDHDRCYTGHSLHEDFIVIPGEEFSTEYGHLLGLFLREEPVWSSFAELVEQIHAQGGLAVLAHPFEHRSSSDGILEILPLLDGIEVWNSRANRKNRRANGQAAELCSAAGLPGFAGSDAHRRQEIGNAMLTVSVEEATPEAIRQALLEGSGTVSGQESPSRYVARSQLTLLQKKKSRSPAAWAKWCLFAVKCCLEDAVRRQSSCH